MSYDYNAKQRKENPFRVNVTRPDGSRVILRFENKRKADRYFNRVNKLKGYKPKYLGEFKGKSKPKKPSNPYMGYLPKGFKVRF